MSAAASCWPCVARLIRHRRMPESHEQAVGVAVEHRETRVLEPALRPQQHLLAHAGDRVRERRVVEAARGRAEHAVEGVHQDLDGVRGHVVAALLRRLAPREQLVEHARQDRGLAAERAAGRVESGRRRGAGSRDVRQRIDVERADDARIQALEVEHPDVRVQARRAARARGRPAARRARASRSSARSARRCRSCSSSLRYRKSNDAMLAATRSGVMPVELAARERERHEIRASRRSDTRAAHPCAHTARTPAGRAR